RQVASMMGKPDYVPPLAAQIHVHAMTVAKADPDRFLHTDGKYCSAVQVNVQKWYGFEQPLAIAPEAYNYEVEALGGELLHSANHMSSINHSNPLIKKPEDIDEIKVPIEREWGRIPYVIDSMNGLKELTGTCSSGAFCGPFSFLCGIHSYTGLIRDIRKNPDFVHQLYKWAIDEVLIPYVRLLKDETGYTDFFGADAWSAVPNTNKKILEEFVFPYNAYLKEQAEKEGISMSVAASADYCEEDPNRFDHDLMKYCWRKMGEEFFGRTFLMMGMGKPELWPMDLMKEYLAENKTRSWTPPVMAGCSASYMRDASPTEIAEYVKRVIDNLGRDGRISFFGIQIPADTPPENVHTFIQAVKTYGVYPIAENLDDVELKIPPDFEPYQDWFRKEVAAGRLAEYE
ncbi:MAG: uroporphyrinogen decarboxylase family protein, partial [Candidatus Thorarchaeota archaeon]